MLDVKKLCASAEECLGWPYVSPGTNDSRGIDCSGLFVKCFRDQGTSIYHGSNTIYRKYCSEKGKLTSASQLRPGMAVFKWNANTPEKFNDGLGDFQHIGLVVSVNPLRIIHASTGTMCVTPDKHYLLFTLRNGSFWDETSTMGVNRGKRSQLPLMRATFDKQYKRFDMSDFSLSKVDAELFEGHSSSLTNKQLKVQIDTMKKQIQDLENNTANVFFNNLYYFNNRIYFPNT